ncbi:restriction endonuclease subunit S [Cocleimonas sp. KMM 6892]|uniref:restriction endonuclease subunit S n=1 Tax=unclassified Cocleimonas TaxID=2639732 RepID=UPI002DBC7A94|nr:MULTISPECIES: restriction endonuclease subunit S [unclassified Cocleimonas]MEB8432979.1 restriction endonuclease subunit S [Cocleimonas sp. KMM 6892]MEC4716040.1 restriction endonuclease subunit S [Cocleimonas sp. KMM 6895]MEC4745501.1 restriction endonuclease subunit S [Cocleimonas sp. KMM 6896]
MGSDWEEARLDMIVNFQPKRTIKKGEDAPFIEMAAIPTNSKVPDYVSSKKYTGGGSRFSNGDTVFARITPCLQNGKTAKIDSLEEDEIAHGSTEFIVLSPYNKYDSNFIYYLARLPHFRAYAESRMQGSTGRQRVAWQALAEYEFQCPPSKDREAIGNFLTDLDDKIELNRQMNETLESMAQALFKSWFVDFDPVIDNALAVGNPIPDVFAERAEQRRELNANAERSPKSGGVSINGSENSYQSFFPNEFEFTKSYGWIPKGWEINRFKDIVEKYIDNRGKTPPLSEVGIPLIEVKHLPENSLKPDLNTKKHVSSETYDTWFRAHLEPDDIIISTVGTIGRICLVSEGEKFTIAQNLLGLRFNSEKASPYFMYYQMDGFRFRHDVDARLVITVQASIKRKDLETIDLLVPPIKLQRAFDNFVEPLIEKLSGDQNIQLSKLRDTLLPKLLSGELRIPDTEKLSKEAGV